MHSKRRDVLRVTSVLALMAATGLISKAQAAEWNKTAFDGKSVADVIKALGGSGTEKSTAIVFTAPDIAENGAVVPVAVTSNIPGTEQIAVLVEKNPNTLAADFTIPAGTEPFVSTRVKMGQTSMVYAAVKAGGKWYVASKEIKVTLGGCGG
ncbi:Tat pathway signal protein [Burkholderiaceae bacterium 16]|nr:Tat pathway signal protein [Burkholderiaceae bacterium 16]